jgi:crotonobetainyl-CoA:carnitine CoA-transferase CaiB-like acyl-CoA transferase
MLNITLPTGKVAKIPGLPLDMDGRKPRVRQQPPKMGQHTKAVLREAGYSASDIEALDVQGTIIQSEEG